MPQLNPTPWFATLVFTWLVFLAVVPPKVTAHTFPKEPTLQNTEGSHTEAPTLTWPWQ